jgi:hypothetical protein
MTIHRVFRLLDIQPKAAPHIDTLFQELTTAFKVSVITSNWDIMAERCLERQRLPFYYGRQTDPRYPTHVQTGLPVWKLHGSGNWGYCDLCRSLITSDLALGKVAVRFGWLLETEDFRLFPGGRTVARTLHTPLRECPLCAGRVAVRVATFSYRKHLDVPFFQSIWDEAREGLREADRWLFIGYSMPEADIEIRHLLKTAELAHSGVSRLLQTRPGRKSARPHIDVVMKGDKAGALRYRRLFGKSLRTIANDGVEAWVAKALPNY